MGRKGHKRKRNHVVLVTSDAVDVKLKQFRIRPWVVWTLTVIFCVFFGTAIGYLYYETGDTLQQTTRSDAEVEQLTAQNQELTVRNAELETQLAAQNERIQILSDTVNQKVESETALLAQLEGLTTPSEFPLTGLATMEEATEGDPMCIFTASSGAMVIATANGTVIAVNDDAEYGHNVWVDHGNGYITIYRSQGDVMVKQGGTVKQGATLFLIGDDDSKLGYQMMRDNEYIDPMELLTIKG
ncbi:MAG: peptidoglycan DD-metalloendopeptidase family protein [Blautia sp.]|nr:peptidoglycan DD-metalloendopeptidase family protein [Blautia sp.]